MAVGHSEHWVPEQGWGPSVCMAAEQCHLWPPLTKRHAKLSASCAHLY